MHVDDGIKGEMKRKVAENTHVIKDCVVKGTTSF